MKIYLSGPMRGKHDDNRAVFNRYAEQLKAEGHTVYNPAVEEAGLSRRDYFRGDMIWICDHAEAMAMIPGWEWSAGARAEHALAQALDDIEFIYLT